MGFCEAGFILKELVLVGRWSLLFILLTQVFLLGVFLVYHDPFPFLFVNFSGQNFFYVLSCNFLLGGGGTRNFDRRCSTDLVFIFSRDVAG